MNISVIMARQEEHKLSLYVDDILLCFSNPSSSIPALKESIKKFAYYSSYKVNVNKTEAIDINSLQIKQKLTVNLDGCLKVLNIWAFYTPIAIQIKQYKL